MTKTYSNDVSISYPCSVAEKWVMDKNNVIANLPYVVGVTEKQVTLRFNRMKLFTYKDIFSIDVGLLGKDFIEYKLDSKTSQLGIMFSFRQNTKECNTEVMVKYKGEKEWIVSKALPEIASEIIKVMKEQVRPQTPPISSGIDLGNLDLGRISDVSKILLKSKLEKTEIIDVESNLAVFLEDLYKDLEKYPIVYISGTGESISFRILMVNGEFKSVYYNDGVRESRDETTLNGVRGKFKINVYVNLSTAVQKKIDNT